MTKRKRRNFTPEFKADAVRLCTSGGKTIAEVRKQFDLTETALRAWVRLAESDGARPAINAAATAEHLELVELRKRVKRLEMERDILKNSLRVGSRLLDQKLPQHYMGRGPGGAAGCFLETATIPLKNMVQGMQRTWQW